MGFRHLNDEVSCGRLNTLRDSVAPILANNLLPHFTDHSVSHSDSLVTIIDHLITPIQTGEHALKPDELMALYSACYLHDIGMQFERAGETSVIENLLHPPHVVSSGDGANYRLAWEELDDDERRRLLREHHHKISAELVKLSVGASEPPIGLQLTDEYFPAVVASLCEAHCVDPDDESTRDHYQSLVQRRGTIRAALLSALLRVADILDASRHRARREKARVLLLDADAQVHWWRHYYTKEITSEADNSIRLWFEFPPEQSKEYSRVIPPLQMRYIEQEFRRNEPIFRSVHLPWYLAQYVVQEPYSTAQKMPELVLASMNNQLSQYDSPALEQRALAEARFLDSSANVSERLSVLRDAGESLSPAERLHQLFSIAIDLAAIGGKRSSWNLLYGAFDSNKAALDPSDQLKVGCELARMMIDDDNADRAHRVIHGLAPIADNLPDHDPRKFDYWRTRARCAFASFFDETEEALNRAIELSSDATQKKDLLADKCEWYLLQGQLKNVLACADKVESEHQHLSLKALLAVCRSRAMLGDSQGAIEVLETAMASQQVTSDMIALAMLKAEILHLDLRDEESTEVFETVIAPAHYEVGNDYALLAMDNQVLASLSLRKAGHVHEFYNLYDRRRLVGVDLWDASAVVSGHDAAKEGRHHEALPEFWGQLIKTYRSGCWRSFRWASKEMARECLEIAASRQEPNWVSEAVFHALNAEDSKLAELIGKRLLLWRDHAKIAAAVTTVLSCATLRRHSSLGAALLAVISDTIPDDQLVDVVNWLTEKAVMEPEDWPEIGLFNKVWQAMESVAHRLSPDVARAVVSTAVNHREWKIPCTSREHLISVVNGCVSVLPAEDMVALAVKALPLASDSDLRFDHDYAAVINLLCHIAERGGDQIKSFIADALYPLDGQPINTILLQIAPLLGKKIREDSQIREWAHSVAEQIRLQVQRLESGQQAAEVRGGSLKCTFTSAGGIIEVKLGSHTDSLNALVRHRHVLGVKELSDLVTAILELAEDADNLLPNRSSLLRGLAQFSDCLSEELVQTAWSRLAGIARGDIRVSSNIRSDSNDPLNPFKFDVGSSDDVQGMAIYALARLTKQKPEEHRLDEMNYLLQRALTARSDEVRRMALVL